MYLEIALKGPKSLTPPLIRRIKGAIRQTVKALPKSLIRKIQSKGRTFSLSVSIVSSGKIKNLNKAFRNKNYPTDVLSFSRIEFDFPFQPHVDVGDLVICFSVAKKQAKSFGQSLGRELERLAVHGTLHLFGYDHERSRKDEQIMFRLQDKILRQISPKHLET